MSREVEHGQEGNGTQDVNYEEYHKIACRAFMRSLTAISAASKDNFRKFKPKPTDVILSACKSGGTWTQQIMHGLRTKGSMEFDEINDVIPCLEMALDDGLDIHGDQPYTPRCFKTHGAMNVLQKGPKYIAVIRDPKDGLVSQFEFVRGWRLPGDMPVEIFAKVFDMERPAETDGILPHPTFHDTIVQWWPHWKDPNTLLLFFEDMKENLPAVVELIAKFMGFDPQDKERIDIATKQATFEFMKANEEKFRTKVRNETEVSVGPSKVHKGTVNRKAMLPQATHQAMDEIWKRDVEPVTGLPNYSELRDHVNRELGRPWAKKSQQQ